MLLLWKGEGMRKADGLNPILGLKQWGSGRRWSADPARTVAVLSNILNRMRTMATISRLRSMVQICFSFFCLVAGYRFYQFYRWAIGQTEIFTARPASVEAFLPISALLGLKRLALTGIWDGIHPAGLAILISAIIIAIFLRKGFCGWICPIGFASNILEKLGRKLSMGVSLPRWLDYPLLSIKYLLLGFFGYIILWKMNVAAIEAFLSSQYNLVSDAKMLLFFLHPSVLTLQVLGILLLISLVIRNFWCRYLCPYGALLGLGALFSPVQVRRCASLCINCKRCDKICPVSIRVSQNATIRHPECIGCMECVEVCPQKNCLTVAGPGRKQISISAYPVMVVGLFLLVWVIALISGHWQTQVPLEEFRALYPAAASAIHP
jgi:polyferredoxin